VLLKIIINPLNTLIVSLLLHL